MYVVYINITSIYKDVFKIITGVKLNIDTMNIDVTTRFNIDSSHN